VPDHALAQIVRVPLAHGRVSYDAHIALRHGPWLEFVTAHANSPIEDSNLKKLALRAANRLNNGLHG
jgi:hypothetical protein